MVSANVPGNPWSVLVVEDDASIARMLRLPLRDVGFDYQHVVTGGDALDVLQTGMVDAVVMDLRLPDQKGRTLLDWLRQVREERLQAAPVCLVMSALDENEAGARYGLPLGDAFLAKPFDPWHLAGTLRSLLEGRPSR